MVTAQRSHSGVYERLETTCAFLICLKYWCSFIVSHFDLIQRNLGYILIYLIIDETSLQLRYIFESSFFTFNLSLVSISKFVYFSHNIFKFFLLLFVTNQRKQPRKNSINPLLHFVVIKVNTIKSSSWNFAHSKCKHLNSNRYQGISKYTEEVQNL